MASSVSRRGGSDHRGPRHPRHLVGAQGLVDHAGLRHRPEQEGDIQLPRNQLLAQIDGQVDIQFQRHARIIGVNLANQFRDPVVDQRLRRAEPNQARERIPVADGRLNFRRKRHIAFRPGQQIQAGRRQLHPAAGPVEQLDAQFFFQGRDPGRNGRLGRAQPVGRRRETPQRRRPDEGFRVLQVHGARRRSRRSSVRSGARARRDSAPGVTGGSLRAAGRPVRRPRPQTSAKSAAPVDPELPAAHGPVRSVRNRMQRPPVQ